MEQEKMEKLHGHLLDIFQEILKICEECHINYFIMAGTALGAVRHGGFIPWDDDLDIGMLREEYERFLKEAPKRLRKDLFLQTYYTEKESPFYFAKVRKDNTKMVENYCRNLNIHDGIYVDIFPYDNIPNQKWKRKKYYIRSKILISLYVSKCVTGTSVHFKGWKKYITRGIRGAIHTLLIPVPKKFLFHFVDRNLRKYNKENTDYVGYGNLPKIQVKKENVLVPKEIVFEGITVKCPAQIKNYLCDNYGEWNKLPPESERKGHIPYTLKV